MARLEIRHVDVGMEKHESPVAKLAFLQGIQAKRAKALKSDPLLREHVESRIRLLDVDLLDVVDHHLREGELDEAERVARLPVRQDQPTGKLHYFGNMVRKLDYGRYKRIMKELKQPVRPQND